MRRMLCATLPCILTVRGTQVRLALPQNCCALVALVVFRYGYPLGTALYCLNLILIAI